MIDALIGGAIAAVIGAAGYAVIGLWLEHRREKAQKLAIVDALTAETFENLLMCKAPEIAGLQCATLYKIETYRAHKGQLLFLPEDVITRLIAAAFIMEDCNTAIQTFLSQVAYGQATDSLPVPRPRELIEHLEFVHKELRKWREEHTRRLFNL
jgi:hypothetical protein